MSRVSRKNGITSPEVWHSAWLADRMTRAERLTLPRAMTLLAVRPEPLDWIFSGKIPQRLLASVLGEGGARSAGTDRKMTREEIVELAEFARRVVMCSVVEPAIGDGLGEIPLDNIPVLDRTYIFEWACGGLGGNQESGIGSKETKLGRPDSQLQTPNARDQEEGHSVPRRGMERFREK